MLKPAGASCPKCSAAFCSEYAQMGKPARWTCHHCGANGDLVGDVSRGQVTKKPTQDSQPKPHWSRA